MSKCLVIKHGEAYFLRGGPKGRGSFWTHDRAKAWEFKTDGLAEATLKNIQVDIPEAVIVRDDLIGAFD